MRRAWLGLLLVLAGLAAAGCTSGNDANVPGGSFTFTSPGGKQEYSYPPADRRPLGQISGPDLTGSKTVSVSDYPGKIVVINFWGSWCAPCRDEASGLQSAWTALEPKGVQFVGIDLKDPQGDGAAFNASKQITYPSIFDFGLRTLLSIRGYPVSIPSTIVLDKQHRVAQIWLHPINPGDLRDAVTPLLAEA